MIIIADCDNVIFIAATICKVVLAKAWDVSNCKIKFSKRFLKICSKFTGEHLSVISIKLLFNFVEITLLHGCSLVSLLHIFRTLFPRNTSGGLVLRTLNKHLLFRTYHVIFYNSHGTVIQTEDAWINDHLYVSKVSWKLCIPTIYNFE